MVWVLLAFKMADCKYLTKPYRLECPLIEVKRFERAADCLEAMSLQPRGDVFGCQVETKPKHGKSP